MTAADLPSAGITASFDGTEVVGFSGVNQYSANYAAGTNGSFKVTGLKSARCRALPPSCRRSRHT